MSKPSLDSKSLTILLALLSAILLAAQNPTSKLDNDLLAIHGAWWKAFDSGDGAAMDQIETDNLTLLMADGTFSHKTKPRAGRQRKGDAQAKHSLSEVSIRQFGSAAILTGILTTDWTERPSRETAATVVVFIQQDGKWKIASASWTSTKDPSEKQ